MTGTESARSLRARETRAALLAAARSVIARMGYQGATIDAIAAAAGVTKGAFYAHFADKDQARDEVLRRWIEDQTERLAHHAGFFGAVEEFIEYDSRRDDALLVAEFWRIALRDEGFRARLNAAYQDWETVLTGLAGRQPGLAVQAEEAAAYALALHDGMVAGRCAGLKGRTGQIAVAFDDAVGGALDVRRTA